MVVTAGQDSKLRLQGPADVAGENPRGACQVARRGNSCRKHTSRAAHQNLDQSQTQTPNQHKYSTTAALTQIQPQMLGKS